MNLNKLNFSILPSLRARNERSNLLNWKKSIHARSFHVGSFHAGSLAADPAETGNKETVNNTFSDNTFSAGLLAENPASSGRKLLSSLIKLFGLFFTITTLFACEPDDMAPEARGKYESGVIIINEGNFGSADGSLSFYDKDSSKVSNSIFEAENDRQLFAIIQNMRFFDDRGYIVTNSDDKIEVVDAANLESIKTIKDDIENPYDIAVVDGLAYVSNWGALTPDFTYLDSRVTIIDLSTSEVIKDIVTKEFPSGVLAVDKQVYVAVGSSDEVFVIDTESNNVTDTITVPIGPKSFQLDKNGKLWVMCTGTFANPAGNLARINPGDNTVESTISLENQSPNGKIALNGTADQLYYLTSVGYDPPSNAVFVFDITSDSAPTEPLIEGTNFYGLGVDPETNTIYIGDSNGFQGNGTVIRYNPDGTEMDNFAVGRGPSGFAFR